MLTVLFVAAIVAVLVRLLTSAGRNARRNDPMRQRRSAAAYAPGDSATYAAGNAAVYEPGDSPTYSAGNAAVYEPGDSPTYSAGNAAVYEPGDSPTYAPASPIDTHPRATPPEPVAEPVLPWASGSGGRRSETVVIEVDELEPARRRYEGSAAISSTALDTTLAMPYVPSSLTPSSLTTSL